MLLKAGNSLFRNKLTHLFFSQRRFHCSAVDYWIFKCDLRTAAALLGKLLEIEVTGPSPYPRLTESKTQVDPVVYVLTSLTGD